VRLGERCDEIVRLIDETLADLGLDPVDAAIAGSPPAAAVTTLAPLTRSAADRRRRQPPAGPGPDQTAAGF
jgi:hypothetical protein